jgi:ribosomal protein L44E
VLGVGMYWNLQKNVVPKKQMQEYCSYVKFHGIYVLEKLKSINNYLILAESRRSLRKFQESSFQ